MVHHGVSHANVLNSYVLKKVYYTFKDVTINPHDRTECEERLGHKVDTVPQIFVDGKYVGGADAFRSFING